MRLNTVSKTKIPVLVVFGATASGKTALAERIFASGTQSSYAGFAEIISADSMQVYRGMDIGTAKPDKELQKRLFHHLIDLFSPCDQFTLGEFVRRSDDACAEIFLRGKLPVILGGTAFYIRNFLYGLPTTPQANDETRQKLKSELERKGALAMYQYLTLLDPMSAARIHLNDEYRILRALEVCVSSGRPLSSFALKEKTREPYRFLVFALQRSREELNERIDVRVDMMFEQGLEAEFLKLTAAGFTRNDPGMQAIGYREFFTAGYCASENQSCIAPDVSEKARELIKTNSKKYAKRQMTFFKSISDTCWISADDYTSIEEAVKFSLKFLPSY